MSSKIERRRPRVTFSTTGASRTKTEFAQQCDINQVMKRFERTGIIDHLNTYQGHYGDFLDVPQDYQAALNQVIRAEAMFMALPAQVRAKFRNDPGEFLAFVDNPDNEDELIELGLARKREARSPEGSTAAAGADTPASGQAAIPPDGG